MKARHLTVAALLGGACTLASAAGADLGQAAKQRGNGEVAGFHRVASRMISAVRRSNSPLARRI